MSEERGKKDGNASYGDHDQHKTLYHWVYVAGFCLLTAIVDFAFLWPENHLWALLALAAAVSLVAIYEMTVRGFGPCTVAATVMCLFAATILAFWVVGPIPAPAIFPTPVQRTFEGQPRIPLEDTEVHGALKSANEPIPPNGCDDAPNVAPDAVKVLIGDNAVVQNGHGKFTAIRVRSCDAVIVDKRPEGVFVDASLYGKEGEPIATISNNQITALNGEHYVARQSYDESAVTVKDSAGRELFYVRFLNPTTIRIRGYFGCHGSATVHITDNHVPGAYISHSCFGGGTVGIQIGNPTGRQSPIWPGGPMSNSAGDLSKQFKNILS